MNEQKELEEINSIKNAVEYMEKLAKYQKQLLKKAENAAEGEQKGISNENLEKVKKELEIFEEDIYEFLLMLIRSMKALIVVEKDESFIENDAHIHNNKKNAIAKEIRVLISELKRVRILDEKGF